MDSTPYEFTKFKKAVQHLKNFKNICIYYCQIMLAYKLNSIKGQNVIILYINIYVYIDINM